MNIVEKEVNRLIKELVVNLGAIGESRVLLERYQVLADKHGLEVVVDISGGTVNPVLVGHFFNGGADSLIAANPAKLRFTSVSGRHIYDVTMGNHVYRIAEDIK